MEKKSEIITAQEAADLLKISRATLQRWIVAGTVKPIDAPHPLLKRRILRFHRADVEKLLA